MDEDSAPVPANRDANGRAPKAPTAVGRRALGALGATGVAALATTDVGVHREQARTTRWQRLAVFLAVVAGLLVLRNLLFPTSSIPMPHVPASFDPYLPAMAVDQRAGAGDGGAPCWPPAGRPMCSSAPMSCRCPSTTSAGSETLVEEVTKTLNLFLAHRTFAEQMGGSPRRAILFEGPPGTGKTYMAKAMAAEAGRALPLRVVLGVPVDVLRPDQPQDPLLLQGPAPACPPRGRGHRLHRGARRHRGRPVAPARAPQRGHPRRGQRAAHPAPVLRTAAAGRCGCGAPLDRCRQRLAATGVGASASASTSPANILVIGATNRAADLDPALLRPGPLRPVIYFDLPSRSGRRDIIDYYLAKKAHEPELDDPTRRETLAAMTAGYSPVMIEHLLDEALVWALRRGADRLSWNDLQQAKMTEEIGLAQPVEYTEAERRTIATHEAGHATVAWLVGKGRKLEVLTIIKRKEALGLLSHSEEEERFTKTKTEMRGAHPDRLRRDGRRGALLRRGIDRAWPATCRRRPPAACQMIGLLGMGSTLISSAAAEYPAGGIVSKVLADESARAGGRSRSWRTAKESVTEDARRAPIGRRGAPGRAARPGGAHRRGHPRRHPGGTAGPAGCGGHRWAARRVGPCGSADRPARPPFQQLARAASGPRPPLDLARRFDRVPRRRGPVEKAGGFLGKNFENAGFVSLG